MTTTSIEWTDATWNPVTGCTKVSPGCAHCYAEGVAERFWGTQYPRVEMMTPESGESHTRPREFTDVLTHTDRLDQPLGWRRPRRVFVNSMSDLFHEAVSDAFLHQVYGVMEQARQHTFQVLTKRATRMKDYLSWRYGPREDGPGSRIPSRHIWHGVSVENRAFLGRIDELKDTQSAVRFVSMEPLLEDVGALMLDRIDWVIVGGESGPKARPCDVAWVYSIVRECQRQDVAVFVKQLGANPRSEAPTTWPNGTITPSPWLRPNLSNRKGGDMAEWPADLRVREYPRP